LQSKATSRRGDRKKIVGAVVVATVVRTGEIDGETPSGKGRRIMGGEPEGREQEIMGGGLRNGRTREGRRMDTKLLKLR